jgi:hypothetical protein
MWWQICCDGGIRDFWGVQCVKLRPHMTRMRRQIWCKNDPIKWAIASPQFIKSLYTYSWVYWKMKKNLTISLGKILLLVQSSGVSPHMGFHLASTYVCHMIRMGRHPMLEWSNKAIRHHIDILMVVIYLAWIFLGKFMYFGFLLNTIGVVGRIPHSCVSYT